MQARLRLEVDVAHILPVYQVLVVRLAVQAHGVSGFAGAFDLDDGATQFLQTLCSDGAGKVRGKGNDAKARELIHAPELISSHPKV